MQGKKYKIINDTIKPPKMSPGGSDSRRAIERIGHMVSFVDGEGRHRVLGPTGQTSCIVDKLTEPMMRHARARRVRIEEIDDVVTALKQHAMAPEAARAVVAEAPAVETVEKVFAGEMGDPTRESVGGTETPEAVNPDGDPNFLVRAPRGGEKKGRSSRRFASEETNTSEG